MNPFTIPILYSWRHHVQLFMAFLLGKLSNIIKWQLIVSAWTITIGSDCWSSNWESCWTCCQSTLQSWFWMKVISIFSTQLNKWMANVCVIFILWSRSMWMIGFKFWRLNIREKVWVSCSSSHSQTMFWRRLWKNMACCRHEMSS